MNAGKCQKCGETRRLTRGYCSTKCYCQLIRHGLLAKIEKKISPSSLNKIQEEVLNGSMLGDGCLFKHPSSKWPYLSIRRNINDIEYLKYEFELFQDFCNIPPKTYDIFDKRTQKIYHGCKFQTRPSEAFMPYYQQWYEEKKIFPPNLELSPLTCAIWFCDDGCVIVDKRINRLKLKLATHCFTYQENCTIASVLKNMFNAHFAIAHDRGSHYIISADAGARKFIEFIKLHIPTSMGRKITWGEVHLTRSKSYAQLKNRDAMDLNEKEQQILILLKTWRSPKIIAKEMGWESPHQHHTPSGIFLYLKRFIKYQWVEKRGTPYSYKTPIQYKLTSEGEGILLNFQ